jgi:hypothetical protein
VRNVIVFLPFLTTKEAAFITVLNQLRTVGLVVAIRHAVLAGLGITS